MRHLCPSQKLATVRRRRRAHPTCHEHPAAPAPGQQGGTALLPAAPLAWVLGRSPGRPWPGGPAPAPSCPAHRPSEWPPLSPLPAGRGRGAGKAGGVSRVRSAPTPHAPRMPARHTGHAGTHALLSPSASQTTTEQPDPGHLLQQAVDEREGARRRGLHRLGVHARRRRAGAQLRQRAPQQPLHARRIGQVEGAACGGRAAGRAGGEARGSSERRGGGALRAPRRRGHGCASSPPATPACRASPPAGRSYMQLLNGGCGPLTRQQVPGQLVEHGLGGGRRRRRLAAHQRRQQRAADAARAHQLLSRGGGGRAVEASGLALAEGRLAAGRRSPAPGCPACRR